MPYSPQNYGMKLNFGAAINTVYGFRGYVALYVTVCQLAAAGGAAETEGAAFAKTVQGLQHQKHKAATGCQKVAGPSCQKLAKPVSRRSRSRFVDAPFVFFGRGGEG